MSKFLLDAALAYARRGWALFPCRADKRPHTRHGFKDSSVDHDQIEQWWSRWPDAGIGLDCGSAGLVVVDCDVKNDVDGIAAFEALGIEHGGALHSQTPSGGLHIIFGDVTQGKIRNSAGKLAPGVDIRAAGGYILLPPSVASGGQYVALDDWDRAPAPIPARLVSLLLDEAPAPAGSSSERYAAAALAGEIHNVMTARDGNRNETLNRAAFALGQLIAGGALSERTVVQALTAAALSIGLSERETAATIASGLRAGAQQPRSVPERRPTLEHDRAYDAPDGHHARTCDAPLPKITELPIAAVSAAIKRGETGDAELLAKMYADRIAFDHSEGDWYIWNGAHWQRDRVSVVANLISYQIAAQYLRCASELQKAGATGDATAMTQRAASLRNRNRINNTLALAEAQPALALTGDEWDANPWRLAVANGVIDLRDGSFSAGAPSDYIRKAAPTPWTGLDAPAARWQQFLSEVFDGDADLISFVHRLLGYGITGLAVEHILPVLWGDGRNGKGTLLETVAAVLGNDIASPTDSSVLMTAGYNSGGGPQPFLYNLRGTRIVWASESNEGQTMNLGLVKRLTGGDTITCRTLHSKPVTFRPGYLILLLTNNKPHVAAEDPAIWDRLRLIPFTQRFVENPQRDNEHPQNKYLPDQLREEASGILAWLVRGCLEWQRVGLHAPAAVLDATDEYRREEDILGQFLSECTTTVSGARTRAADLYTAYSNWCQENGITPRSNTTFGKKVKRFYLKDGRDMHGVYYEDVGLLTNSLLTNPM